LAVLAGAQHWASATAAKFREKFLPKHLWNVDPAKRGEPLLIFANGEAKFGYFDKMGSFTKSDGAWNLEPASFVSLKGAPLVFEQATRGRKHCQAHRGAAGAAGLCRPGAARSTSPRASRRRTELPHSTPST
jgi:hypothetical protein